METGEMTTMPSVNAEPYEFDYETKAQLSVHNDTLSSINGKAVWSLRDRMGNILRSGESEVSLLPMSVLTLDEIDFCKTDTDSTYFSYALIVNGQTVSDGTALFTAPKYFDFADPHLRYEINGDELTVSSDAYAYYVEISSLDSDLILSDNYFSMNAGKKTVKILEGEPKNITLRSAYDIK